MSLAELPHTKRMVVNDGFNRAGLAGGSQSVLGSMLISPDIIPDILSQMTDSDFNGQSLVVFQGIRYLFSQGYPADAVSVRDLLGSDMSSYLMQLMEITPTAANFQRYVDLAKKQAKVQQLKEIGQMLADSDDADQQQKILEKAIVLNARRPGMKAITMRECVAEFVGRHNSGLKVEYLQWPIREMQDLLFVEPGDFVIIGGRPSAGKTAFALQCAWSMAEKQRVAFFSLETGQKKLTDRQISEICSVPFENIKLDSLNEQHWLSVFQFGGSDLSLRPMEIVVDSSLTVTDITSFSLAKQYKVIFIDYLQLLKASGATSYEQVTSISRDLHRFAQSSGCAVIRLSQLSRAGNGDGIGKKKASPDMSSLRESGQLEQDADAILLLYLEDEKNYASRRILKCAKNKDGERFRMMLDFDGKYQRFSKAKDFGQYNSEMARIINSSF